MWDEDYCSNSSTYDCDSYSPEWDDEGSNEAAFVEILAPANTEGLSELDPSEITWRVQISYSNGEQQDIRCGEDDLPERVDEPPLENAGIL